MSAEDIFNIPPKPSGDEYFCELLDTGSFIVEKIVSYGIPTPENGWYEQPYGEWACVLRGEAALLYGDGTEEILKEGRWVYIPPMKKHRVEKVTNPCLWLAVKEKSLPSAAERP